MKNLWILIFFILTGYAATAQKSNLVFYTEQGESFYLFLDGIQQNAGPLSNVMISDLPGDSYKVKVKFEDASLGEINKNLLFGQGTETTFVIRMSNSDEWVIRYIKEVPVAQAPVPPQDRSVIVFRTEPPVRQEKVSQNTATSTTTTTITEPVEGASAGVSVSDPSTTVIINMNVGGITNTASSSTTTSTSTISTSTTTSEIEAEPEFVYEEPVPVALPGYGGPVGCPWPMSPEDFNMVKSSITSKSFEDSKLTIAKQVLNSNCLLSSQVKEIMLLFTYEDTRLEFAKDAYGHTYDIGNYYRLNDAFTFESTIDELNDYISAFRR